MTVEGHLRRSEKMLITNLKTSVAGDETNYFSNEKIIFTNFREGRITPTTHPSSLYGERSVPNFRHISQITFENVIEK